MSIGGGSVTGSIGLNDPINASAVKDARPLDGRLVDRSASMLLPSRMDGIRLINAFL